MSVLDPSLAQLLSGELDPEQLSRLRAADPELMREQLSKYLGPEQVEGIVSRVQKLLAAVDETTAPPITTS